MTALDKAILVLQFSGCPLPTPIKLLTGKKAVQKLWPIGFSQSVPKCSSLCLDFLGLEFASHFFFYSPSFRPHYNINMESIAVNGQPLPIDPSVFSTSNTRGTIVDSGTTLAYLAEEAYDPFVNAINQVVLQSVRPFVSRGNQCYLVTSSVSDIFPPVTLNFAGGASMVLNPQEYLLQQNSINGAAVWCIGFQKIQGQGLTILGDLVLKDKIVVYDLAAKRIGWANYDCSTSVNVSATTSTGKSEFVNAGQIDNNSSSHDDLQNLIRITTLLSFLTILVFVKFSFL